MGPGWPAVFSAAGCVAIFNVARDGQLLGGRPMAFDPPNWAFLRVGPPFWAFLRVGPPRIVALRCINVRGGAKLAPDPSEMVLQTGN